MKPKTLAELDELHDELVIELAVLSQATDALKAAQRNPKWVKKKFEVLPKIRGKAPPPLSRPPKKQVGGHVAVRTLFCILLAVPNRLWRPHLRPKSAPNRLLLFRHFLTVV
jgi:hypothetical protein